MEIQGTYPLDVLPLPTTLYMESSAKDLNLAHFLQTPYPAEIITVWLYVVV